MQWRHAHGERCNKCYKVDASHPDLTSAKKHEAEAHEHEMPLTATEALRLAQPARNFRGKWRTDCGDGKDYNNDDKYFYETPPSLDLQADDSEAGFATVRVNLLGLRKFAPRSLAVTHSLSGSSAAFSCFVTAEECALWVARWAIDKSWLPGSRKDSR